MKCIQEAVVLRYKDEPAASNEFPMPLPMRPVTASQSTQDENSKSFSIIAQFQLSNLHLIIFPWHIEKVFERVFPVVVCRMLAIIGPEGVLNGKKAYSNFI